MPPIFCLSRSSSSGSKSKRRRLHRSRTSSSASKGPLPSCSISIWPSIRPRRLMSRRRGSSFGSKPTPGGRSAYPASGTLVDRSRIFTAVRVTLPRPASRGSRGNVCRRELYPHHNRDGALRISQRSIEDVREAANIVEVASEFTALRRQGTRFVGLCPYPDHSEKTPSFSVTPDRGFYYCFGCLEANERIWTSRGLIPIAAAEIGDEVIGLDGCRETITDKWFKSGTTLRIKTGATKEGIELTPDHWCVFLEKGEALRAISEVHPRHSGGDRARFSRKLRKKDLDMRLSVEHASVIREG